MNTAPSSARVEVEALKRAAAEGAVQMVENDMVVGLGSGSTAAFAVSAQHAVGARNALAQQRIGRSNGASIACDLIHLMDLCRQ
jgi:ribose 5-phosphate isomerase